MPSTYFACAGDDAGATLTASAANSGICGENVTWTLNNGVLTISGTGAMKDQDLPCDFSKLTFSKAVIQDGVTSIGQMSFERCFGLKSVTIASSVTLFRLFISALL